MKRFKKNIGLVLTILGMFLVIGTADGSNYEIILRLTGVVMFAVGGYMSEAFYFQQDNKQ